MNQHAPPSGWFQMYMDPSQSWAPFVASEHIGDYVGPSFHLFKEQFGNLADVDNITVVGPVDALEVLIPEGMVSVGLGLAQTDPDLSGLFMAQKFRI